MNILLTEKISEIIQEFTEIPDGSKQDFDIYDTEAYRDLKEAGLTNEIEVINLTFTINNLVNSYEQLCDMFGDYDW